MHDFYSLINIIPLSHRTLGFLALIELTKNIYLFLLTREKTRWQPAKLEEYYATKDEQYGRNCTHN
jgi:hypothetical protein